MSLSKPVQIYGSLLKPKAALKVFNHPTIEALLTTARTVIAAHLDISGGPLIFVRSYNRSKFSSTLREIRRSFSERLQKRIVFVVSHLDDLTAYREMLESAALVQQPPLVVGPAGANHIVRFLDFACNEGQFVFCMDCNIKSFTFYDSQNEKVVTHANKDTNIDFHAELEKFFTTDASQLHGAHLLGTSLAHLPVMLRARARKQHDLHSVEHSKGLVVGTCFGFSCLHRHDLHSETEITDDIEKTARHLKHVGSIARFNFLVVSKGYRGAIWRPAHGGIASNMNKEQHAVAKAAQKRKIAALLPEVIRMPRRGESCRSDINMRWEPRGAKGRKCCFKQPMTGTERSRKCREQKIFGAARKAGRKAKAKKRPR